MLNTDYKALHKEKKGATEPARLSFRCIKCMACTGLNIVSACACLFSHQALRRWNLWPCGSPARAGRHTPAARASWTLRSVGLDPRFWYRTWSPARGGAGRVWCWSVWRWGCCQLNPPGWRAQAPPCSRGDGGTGAPERTRCTGLGGRRRDSRSDDALTGIIWQIA